MLATLAPLVFGIIRQSVCTVCELVLHRMSRFPHFTVFVHIKYCIPPTRRVESDVAAPQVYGLGNYRAPAKSAPNFMLRILSSRYCCISVTCLARECKA